MAGPVYAASVILPDDFPFFLLADSKKLSPVSREIARFAILEGALAWGLGWASAAEIDEINIHKASLLAMRRSFLAMTRDMDDKKQESSAPKPKIDRVIVDGLFTPELPVACEAMVQADGLIYAVMAASILAKTSRDRLMEYYGIFYPQYGYERHKGYPTKAHREAILRYGPSPIQRLSFRFKT